MVRTLTLRCGMEGERFDEERGAASIEGRRRREGLLMNVRKAKTASVTGYG